MISAAPRPGWRPSRAGERACAISPSFIYDILGQFRTLVYEVSTDVLSSIKRNGNLQPRSVVQLKNLIDQLGNLNFFGDRDIDRFINSLQAIVNQAPDARNLNIGSIESQLRDIATISRRTLIAIGEAPRSPKGQSLSGLGLHESPPPELVRQARKNIEISPAAALPDLEINDRKARNGN